MPLAACLTALFPWLADWIDVQKTRVKCIESFNALPQAITMQQRAAKLNDLLVFVYSFRQHEPAAPEIRFSRLRGVALHRTVVP